MSIEAIRQVTETEQANKQSRAAAEAEARQLVLDAERNGTELLKQVRSDAAEQGLGLGLLHLTDLGRHGLNPVGEHGVGFPHHTTLDHLVIICRHHWHRHLCL